VGGCVDVLGFEKSCDAIMGFEFCVTKLGVFVDLVGWSAIEVGSGKSHLFVDTA